jgi:HTH-type transcriptional regulator / antitoxin HigA
MNPRIESAMHHWRYVAPLLQPARNEKEYAELVEALDAAMDAGGANENHPLARLVDYLGELVAEYEAKDEMPPAATAAEVLCYLMQRDHLRQIDIPELGSQGVVSELLAGRRGFNVRQAKAMATKFGVSAALFL